jgi:hypothetical protein
MNRKSSYEERYLLGPYISIGADEKIWYFPRHHLLEGEGAEASCFLLCIIMSGSK